MLQTYILLQDHKICMIEKKHLLNKYVTYIDKDGKYRTQKVCKVYSSHVTVRTIVRIKTTWKFPKSRIHKSKVLGRQKKSGVEAIKW